VDALVTYDISTVDRAGQRRLAKVAKVCEGYGLRVQKSVFECRLSADRHQRLIGELLDVIDPACDSVRIYRFTGPVDVSRTTLGANMAIEPSDPWIV
jgi:CRISPR-associated protein Cas2